jgi:hypothetical protein
MNPISRLHEALFDGLKRRARRRLGLTPEEVAARRAEFARRNRAARREPLGPPHPRAACGKIRNRVWVYCEIASSTRLVECPGRPHLCAVPHSSAHPSPSSNPPRP